MHPAAEEPEPRHCLAPLEDWGEFAAPGAPEMDFVFTVCDDAAGEACPIWPGQPMTAHWGVPDPAKVEGTDAEKRLAFAETYRMPNNRISVFISLPLDTTGWPGKPAARHRRATGRRRLSARHDRSI